MLNDLHHLTQRALETLHAAKNSISTWSSAHLNSKSLITEVCFCVYHSHLILAANFHFSVSLSRHNLSKHICLVATFNLLQNTARKLFH